MATTVQGRTAIVTGAGSGIGEAIAKRLAAEGANVVVADLNQLGIDHVVSGIQAAGGQASGHRADVTSADDVRALCAAAESTFGSLDILVNNAGIILPEVSVMDAPEDGWDRILEVNLKSQFLCVRAAAPIMASRAHGRIVNISSRAWLGTAGLSAYSASKAGVVGLTRTLALELGPRGITVNSIGPGAIQTPLFSQMPEDEQARVRQNASRTPIPRLGQPDEIANAVVFFAADESGFITGQMLYVCGGRSIGYSVG
jgi:3-oxoacyl-[acyl-carrier protein] reductase